MASDPIETGNSPTAAHSSTPSHNINRRSLSIFSRRGADTPAPATQALAMASMSMAFASPPTPGPNNKHKRWRLSKDIKTPEGTILRMVPKDAPVVEMTPLEKEMATSPNEEILRSIGMGAPDSAPTTPVQTFPPKPLADNSNTSPRRYYPTRRERKNSQSDVIGVWRNGKAQWESVANSDQENDASSKSAPGTDTGSGNTLKEPKTDKPKIQVIIPNNPSARRPFNFVPFFSRSGSEPASKAITVSHTNSQDISPPSDTSRHSIDSFQVSAVSPPRIVHNPISRRPQIPIITSFDEPPVLNRNLYPERPSHAPNRSLSNSSTSESDHEDNVSETHSSRSSMTSIGDHPTEAVLHATQGTGQSCRESSSSAVSFINGDDKDHSYVKAHVSPAAQPAASTIGDDMHMADFIGMMRSPSMQRSKAKKRVSSSRRTLKLARIDSKEELRTAGRPSPTLSEAEQSLEDQLIDFSQDFTPKQHQIRINLPVPEIVLPPVDAPPPPPPRKSSKRKTRKMPVSVVPEESSEASSAAIEATKKDARKFRQQRVAVNQKAAITSSKVLRSASVRSILSQVCEDEEIQPVDANAAETVVLHILNGVQSLQDLFNTAVITKGFYKVFKAHEMDSIRRVLRTQNSAAWEYLEICRQVDVEDDDLYSAGPFEEYTPTKYIQKLRADCSVISDLKSIISGSCQSLLRNETRAQSFTASPFTCSSRIDSALWRIWSFCQIFGCGKGREDDLIAQMDWLRGGILAHQDSCSSTISTSDSFYISSVLLAAPDHFGKGNNGGLTAEELYDILEMLLCLNNLARSLLGKTEQARQFGIFDNTDVEGGDIDGEEVMLGKSLHTSPKVTCTNNFSEEWTHYILTLGLQPILELATGMNNDPISVFSSAQAKGWTKWTPPVIRDSRKNFLHEAVSRLYEEKICEAFSPEQSRRAEMRSIRRSRVPSFHSEIQHQPTRKLSVTSSVRTSASERSMMSGWEGLNPNPPVEQSAYEAQSSAPTTVVRNAYKIVRKPVGASPPPPARSAPLQPHAHSAPTPSHQRFSFTPSSPSTPRSYQSHPSPPSIFPALAPQPNGSWLSTSSPPDDNLQVPGNDSLPIYPGRPTSWSQHPFQIQMSSEDNRMLNTAEKATFRIVEMGFTHEEAKNALRITDMGDGLRVDRAVEFLLRRRM
ncbi:hypothetical protein E6O75_ATG06725 [Venturia nashicola]|uniref:UBA domain-containing protein n=1 Tax=Venturia nashicola TaxID=86259 RepID=A0A4Z1PAE7_9PEZI|nr:hypothetical protein E6O75_ATG06725 [Venturia nashicola]